MKKLLLAVAAFAASFCGFAATHTITDLADHASAKDALRVKTGDTITLPQLEEGSYQAINTRILQIEGNVATVLMPGIVGIQQLDGSGSLVAVAAVLSVPDPIADGRVYQFYESKNGSWTGSTWVDLTDSLAGVSGGYPHSTNDIAIVANYEGWGMELNIPEDIALGGLMAGAYKFKWGMENYKYWIRGPQGGPAAKLTFARTDGESPWIRLCPGANLIDVKTENYIGFGFESDYPLEVVCSGDVVCDMGWDGTDPESCHSRLKFGKTSALVIPEASSLTFVNASPRNKGGCDSTVECLGALSGAGRFINRARASIKIDFDATNFYGTFVDASAARDYDRNGNIWALESDKFPNAGVEIVGYAKMKLDQNSRPVYVRQGGAGYFVLGVDHSWPELKYVGNRLPAREVRSRGGTLDLMHHQRDDWGEGKVLEYKTKLLAFDNGFTFVNISIPGSPSHPALEFAATNCVHAYPASASLNCQKLFVRQGLRENGSLYCPWYAQEAVNGVVPWFAAQEAEFYMDNVGHLAFPYCDEDGYLTAANLTGDDLNNIASGANAYVENNKGLGLTADKTVNSLVINNQNSNGSRCLGEGRKLTITSGGLIFNCDCSRLGDWKWATTANELEPSCGTVEFGDTAYVYANNQHEGMPNVIAATIVAPKGFVAAYPGFLAIVGDQTGIDKEIVVNAGTLLLGCKINGEGNNSLAQANVDLGCQIDVPVRIVGGGATLKINQTQTLDPTQNVYFEDIGGFAGKLVLPEGAVEECAGCYVDGKALAGGTYGATGSGAANIDDDHFAGLGVLRVPNPIIKGTGTLIFIR